VSNCVEVHSIFWFWLYVDEYVYVYDSVSRMRKGFGVTAYGVVGDRLIGL